MVGFRLGNDGGCQMMRQPESPLMRFQAAFG